MCVCVFSFIKSRMRIKTSTALFLLYWLRCRSLATTDVDQYRQSELPGMLAKVYIDRITLGNSSAYHLGLPYLSSLKTHYPTRPGPTDCLMVATALLDSLLRYFRGNYCRYFPNVHIIRVSALVLNALTQPSEDNISSGISIFMSGDICICAPKHDVDVPYSLLGSLHLERANCPLIRVYQ